uniref:Putative cytotoxin n=2 Tax=Ixodes ricinus TaxID=34613 RepID=V5GLM0_IXORI
MACSVPLILGAVFLLAQAMQQTGAAKPRVFDLTKKIQEFVDLKSRFHNVPVDWWNMYGNHSHLIENAEKYGEYKVNSTVGSFQYGNVSKSSFDTKVVSTERLYNDLHTGPVTVTGKRTKTRTYQYSWQTQEAVSVGGSISIEVGVPTVVGSTGSLSKTVSLSTTTGQVETVSEEYAVDVKVTVPPRKKAKIEWVVTDVIQEIPWTAQIDIKGWFAVWFREKIDFNSPLGDNYHHLWFPHVRRLEDPLLKRTEEGVRYTARGIFTGVHGAEAHLRVSEYDIGSDFIADDGGRPTDVYTIPVPSPHVHMFVEGNYVTVQIP